MTAPIISIIKNPPGISIGGVVFPVHQDHAHGTVYAEIPGIGRVAGADLESVAAVVETTLKGMMKKVATITAERRDAELTKARAKRDAAQAALRQSLTRETAWAYQGEATAYAFMALLFSSVPLPAAAEPEPRTGPSRRLKG